MAGEWKTLDDLIAEGHPVRYRRKIRSVELRSLLGREREQCIWCGNQLPRSRGSWCSDGCADAFRRRCYGWHIKPLFRRDGGVCSQCGVDTVALEQRIISGRYRAEQARRYCSAKRFDRLLKYARWEADHITPVVMGGGLCDLDGYRTLCVKCHRIETDYLHAVRARRPKECR